MGINLDSALGNVSLGRKGIQFGVNNSGAVPDPVSVVVSSSAALVDGLFHISIVFDREVSGFVVGDIGVVNGSAEYLITDDNISFDCWVMPDGVDDVDISIAAGVCNAVDNSGANSISNTLTVTINTTWELLSDPTQTHFYYDFRELVGVNNDTIIAADPGLRDLSGNERNGTRINSPQVRTLGAIDVTQKGIVALKDSLTGAVSIAETGSTFFNSDFSLNCKIQSADGQPAADWIFAGNVDGIGNIGLQLIITTAGKLQIKYQGFVWLSTSAVLANGQSAIADFFIDFDFTNDVLTVKQNNVAVPGSFTSSNISGVDPLSYACGANFYIAALNNNGTADSNANNGSIFYFIVTSSQGTTSTIRSYIEAKKTKIELIATLEDADYLKNPHDVVISGDGTKAYVVGKGDAVLTNQDGSLGIIGITTPESPTVLGGYANQGDQNDGETVIELSATRIMHFVDDAALLFDVSVPASPAKLRTVANGNGVVNGVVQIGNYLFGANKGGFIDVFDVSTIDSFTLVGSYDTNAVDGMIGPHDVDVTEDGEHIVIVSRSTGAQFAIYKVMNAGVLIPIASWVRLSFLNSTTGPDLRQANRVRVMGTVATVHTLETTANNVVNIDISNLSSPTVLCDFSLGSTEGGSAGCGRYRNKYQVTATHLGLRLLDVVTDPSNIVQDAGYYNAIDFTDGVNQNFHDCKVFYQNNIPYVIMTCQNDGIAIFKLNGI